MTKDELDKYKELEFVVEKLVDYCNNTEGMATACELIAVEAALERLYKARQPESEKDMTKEVINKGKTAFPIVGQLENVHGIGITMRDYFAARAMEALLSRLQRPLWPQDGIVVAEDAYFMADHMLKAREAK
jgi:hypothetical protein